MKMNNTEIIIEVIEIITGEKVKYITETKETFTVYNYLTINVEKDGYLVTNQGYDPCLLDMRSTLNVVMMEASKKNGLMSFKNKCVPLKNMHPSSIDHIHRMSSANSNGLTSEMLYHNILFTDGSTVEVGELLNVNSKLVKSIRSANRKAIINSIINEVVFEKNKPLAQSIGSCNIEEHNEQSSNEEVQIMQGVITKYLESRGFGFIKGNDDETYFFNIKETLTPDDINDGARVEFFCGANKQGLMAYNVSINNNADEVYDDDDDYDDDDYDDEELPRPLEGKITRYIRDKGFGFIKGSDRETYFFHIKDVYVIDDDEINNGAQVSFYGRTNYQGLIAYNVSIHNNTDEVYDDDEDYYDYDGDYDEDGYLHNLTSLCNPHKRTELPREDTLDWSKANGPCPNCNEHKVWVREDEFCKCDNCGHSGYIQD